MSGYPSYWRDKKYGDVYALLGEEILPYRGTDALHAVFVPIGVEPDFEPFAELGSKFILLHEEISALETLASV